MRNCVITAVLMMLAAGACGTPPISDGEPSPDHGVWRQIDEAPIRTRAFTVAGWSGGEALFWAGTNLQRNFANTTGAAYDPASDTWRELAVPGWGHPGLTGAVFEGELFVAAKGGGSRIDPSTGQAVDLPHVDGFVLATLVVADDAVWGVGPTGYSPDDNGIGIARYMSDTDAWASGTIFAGGPDWELFNDQLFVTQPVVWNGSEIIVWNPDGRGLAFDPAAEKWRTLPVLTAPSGVIVDSEVAVAGSTLAALAQTDDFGYGIAVRDGDGWSWSDLDLEVTDFETVSVAGGDDWLVLFMPDQPPITIHLPTGELMLHDPGSIQGVQAPNVVWTGRELVVWGGFPAPGAAAVWTPPAG